MVFVNMLWLFVLCRLALLLKTAAVCFTDERDWCVWCGLVWVFVWW